MNIRKYAATSIDNATEIAQLLTDEEVITLAGEVGAMGLATWTEWQLDHDAMIFDFVSSTPAQRKKRKEWNDPVLLRKLVLAGVVYCLSAHELLDFLAGQELLLRGLSYRDTTALADRAYNEIRYTQVPDWPDCFANICDDPF